MMPYLMCECDTIACSASQLYYWLKRPDSIMGTISEKKVSDWEKGIDQLLNFTEKKYPQNMEYVEGWVATVIWHIAVDQLIFTERYPEHARRIQEKYGSILKKSWNCQRFPGPESLSRPFLCCLPPVIRRCERDGGPS